MEKHNRGDKYIQTVDIAIEDKEYSISLVAIKSF